MGASGEPNGATGDDGDALNENGRGTVANGKGTDVGGDADRDGGDDSGDGNVGSDSEKGGEDAGEAAGRSRRRTGRSTARLAIARIRSLAVLGANLVACGFSTWLMVAGAPPTPNLRHAPRTSTSANACTPLPTPRLSTPKIVRSDMSASVRSTHTPTRCDMRTRNAFTRPPHRARSRSATPTNNACMPCRAARSQHRPPTKLSCAESVARQPRKKSRRSTKVRSESRKKPRIALVSCLGRMLSIRTASMQPATLACIHACSSA